MIKQRFRKLLLLTLLPLCLWSQKQSFDMLTSDLSGKSFDISYYFWLLDTGEAFLTAPKKTEQGSEFAIWEFTNPDKKWRPVHNAKNEREGFEAISKVFDGVALDKATREFSVGKILPTAQVPDNIKNLVDKLADKTHKISHMFWISPSSKAYLVAPKKDGSLALWYFTNDKDWQPLYNATGVNKNFIPAPKTFADVSLDLATGNVQVGAKNEEVVKALDEMLQNGEAMPTLKFSSDDIENEKAKYQAIDDLSPQLKWDINSSSVKSFAIEVIDLDYKNSLHWGVVNIPMEVKEFARGVEPNYNDSTTLTNDYQSNIYTGPFPPAGEEHRYQITLYATYKTYFETEGRQTEEVLKEVKDSTLLKSSIIFKFKSKEKANSANSASQGQKLPTP